MHDKVEMNPEPLTLISLAKEPCENFWKGDCEEAGRYPNAKYGADAYCFPCKLRHVIGLNHDPCDS